jgi:hypothetical protein
MGFFDDAQPSLSMEQDADIWRPAWSGPPGNEIPGDIPGSFLLGRSEDAAILVDGMRAYSTGWTLTLSLLQREIAGPKTVVDPFGPSIPIDHLPAGMTPQMYNDRMRFGVVFSNGASARSDMMFGVLQRKGAPDGPILWPCGGGMGSHAWSSTLWCWPLPPPGPVRLVVQWPEFDIPERSLEIDGAPILEAVECVVEMWPPEQPASRFAEQSLSYRHL